VTETIAIWSGLSDDGAGTVTRRPGVWKPLQTEPCALWRTKSPYAFAVGEPVTYVQAPKAKGLRNRSV
jgi:hypothetical protein